MATKDQTLELERTRVKLTPGQIGSLVVFVAMSVGWGIEIRASIGHINDRLDGNSDSPGLVSRVKRLEAENGELRHDLFVMRQDVSAIQELVKSGMDPRTLRRVGELLERVIAQAPEKPR